MFHVKHPPLVIQMKKGWGVYENFRRISRVIDILMGDGMTYEEAVEYFEFNIAGAWVGESTPFFLQKMEL